MTSGEAVLLGHSLLCRLAEVRGLRLLFIKGPILATQGLREPRGSVDVDVLVDPARFLDLRAALEEHGWRDQGPYAGAFVLPLHSATYRHENWPCEIDVHDRFPGFFADPQVVFEALWARRTTATVAEVEVPCCDLIGNAAIAALHALRDPQFEQSQQDLAFMADVLKQRLDEAGKAELAELAGVTGATDTLRPFLAQVGAPLTEGNTTPEDLLAWEIRVTSNRTKTVPWLTEFARTPVHRWPATLWRALMLSEVEIRRNQPDAAPGAWGLFRARGRRIGWGMRNMPEAARIVWRAHHRRVHA